MQNLIQKLSTNCRLALKNAFAIAQELNSQTVTPANILGGIVQQKGSIGAEILYNARLTGARQKIPFSESELAAAREFLKPAPAVNQLKLAAASKKLLEKAAAIAADHHHHYVGTEHLIAALLDLGDPEITKIFQQTNIDPQKLKAQTDIVLKSASKFPDIAEAIDSMLFQQANKMPAAKPTRTKAGTALEFFATNLTDPEIQKTIDPVIGREEEISRLIQILGRKTKNNPLLLGDTGVGKTAIVEGLAKKIVQGEVPDILVNKKIYSLDLGLVIAGSSFRGEFENRLQQIIEEIKQNPDLILFIDEIHNIIGTGAAPGSLDAANLLKPPLAKGEVRCIGATTLAEYKKYLENDAALERRFQPIIIEEPTVEKTIEILAGIKENYESYHGVTINDQAIEAAAKLSARFLPDKFLPDKAIDIIDEAAAAFKIKETSGRFKKIRELQKQVAALQNQKKQAVTTDDFDTALEYRQQEIQLHKKIIKLEQEAKSQPQPKSLGQITPTEISTVISKMTGIPLANLITEEKKRYLNLEKLLAKKIIGQEEAINTLAEFIRRARVGISDSQRPIGSFIFLGPSGVGKTELAKVIAETVFGRLDSLIRIDMSEFAESFNISKLIGSPAGYVGYRDATTLTDSVRRKPYCVILFDEIEKAHPLIFNLLLQILEDGHLTDAAGKKINFKNTIIIMTSNLGTDKFNRTALGFGDQASLNFEEVKKDVIKQVNDTFKAEFLNRVDKIIIFNSLNIAALTKIADLQLKELSQRLEEKNITLNYDSSVPRLIAKISQLPNQGARAIRKNILELVENPIAKKMLAGKNQKSFKVVVKEGGIMVQ